MKLSVLAMKLSVLATVGLALGLLTGAAVDAQSPAARSAAEQRNVERAHEFLSLFQKSDADALTDYVKEDYVEHAPGVTGGRKGFLDFVRMLGAKFPNRAGASPSKPPMTLVDGDITIMLSQRGPSGEGPWLEMHRWENGRKTEHWDPDAVQAPATAVKLAARTPVEQRNLDLVLKGHPGEMFMLTIVDGDLVGLLQVRDAPARALKRIIHIDLFRVRDGKVESFVLPSGERG